MSDPGRLTPFEVAFGPFVPERLGAVHRDLALAEIDPFDRDAWAISQPGASLLHELRPDTGLGEAVSELVALAHAAFLYWQLGERIHTLDRTALDALVHVRPPAVPPSDNPRAYYLQLPPQRVWGSPVAGAAPEPLDGWFAVARADHLALVAVFGLLAGRPGFTVAHADGPRPGVLAREDGTPLFTSVLAGGATAGLWSLVGEGELLELGWRAHQQVLADAFSAPVKGSSA